MSCCEIGDLLNLAGQGVAAKGIARKASDVHYHGAPMRCGDAHLPAELIKLTLLLLPLSLPIHETRNAIRDTRHAQCNHVRAAMMHALFLPDAADQI